MNTIEESSVDHIRSISEFIGVRIANRVEMEDWQYKNWHVTLKNDEVVVAGSLTNYVAGSNQQSISLEQCKKGLDSLSIPINLTPYS